MGTVLRRSDNCKGENKRGREKREINRERERCLVVLTQEGKDPM